MTIGSWGGGAVMAENPIASVPVLNLLARAPFGAVGLCMIGSSLLVVSWLTMMRYALPIRHYSRGETAITQMTRGQTWTVLAGWSLPLFFSAPMFSKDVYSYVAFGYAAHLGLDVYTGGPQDLLHAGPLVDNVPLEWRHTPAQYGPGFITLARFIAFVCGDNIIGAIVCYRIVALISLIALSVSLRWLAHKCNMRAATALWLGVLNPLTLFHMVAGIHNEALMMAFTMVGLALGLKALEFSLKETRAWNLFLSGAVFISLGAMIKLPAAVALGFLGMAAARRWWHRWYGIPLVTSVLTLVLALVASLMSVLSGCGWSWLSSTGAAAKYPTILTPSNNLAEAMTALTRFFGLGDHYQSLRNLSMMLGGFLAVVFLLWCLWQVYRHGLNPVGGFGLSMFIIVLCFPVMHPWYLLWGFIAMSAWINDRRYRIPAVVVSAIVAIWIMPQGGTMPTSLNLALGIETGLILGAALIAWRVLTVRGNNALKAQLEATESITGTNNGNN